MALQHRDNSNTGSGVKYVHYEVRGARRDGPKWTQNNSSALSVTALLDGDGLSTPRPGHFTPRERDHCTGAGWDPGPVCEAAENLSSGFSPRTVQLTARRYTD